MAIAFRSEAHNNAAANTTLTLNKPSGTADDDGLIAVVATTTSVSHSGPAGWTQIGSTVSNTNIFVSAWKKVASSEGASWNWTWGSKADSSGIVLAASGVDTDVAVLVDASGSRVDTSNPDVIAPGVTTTLNGCLLYTFHQSNQAQSSWTDPSGMTRAGVQANNPSVLACYEARPTAGATGTRTATPNTTPGRNIGYTVALTPDLTHPTGTDSAALGDSIYALTVIDVDAGTLAESSAPGPTDTDSGTMADSTVVLTLLATDAATLGESSVLTPDSGTILVYDTDAASVAEVPAIMVTATDAATLADAMVATSSTFAGTDSATLTEATTGAGGLVLTLTGTDSGTLAEGAVSTFATLTRNDFSATMYYKAGYRRPIPLDTDAATVAEAFTLTVTATDTAALGETVALTLSPAGATDSGTLSESVVLRPLGTDTLTVADTAAAGPLESKTGTDSATLTETSSFPSLAFARTDAATLAESSVVRVIDTDTGTVAEVSMPKPSDTDAFTLAEALVLRPLQTDAATLTEAVTGRSVIASDSAALGETALVQLAGVDALALAEASAFPATAAVTGTDAFTMSDASTASGGGGSVISGKPTFCDDIEAEDDTDPVVPAS